MSAIAELAQRDISVIWRGVVNDIRTEYLSEENECPWIIGFSGGKDSTVLVQAVFEAMLSIAPFRRCRDVHIVSNDTLVESPLVIDHIKKSQKAISEAADNWKLPITIATTSPAMENSFWVLLIGKGYPSPNQTMRWCTSRLKIQPTSKYIIEQVNSSGAAIVLLGVRLDESKSRHNNIIKWNNIGQSNLSPHPELRGAFVYRPIVNLTTDQVWEVIASYAPPWGGTNDDLIKLYRDAEGGECPVVMSKSDVMRCGTTSGRFGCWTCTVVEKDKSLQGFIDSGKDEYQPLVDFRNWLKSIRNNPDYRSAIRRNGRIQFDKSSGKHIPGPFTVRARKMILDKLLTVQEEYGSQLISNDDINMIKSIWAADLSKSMD